MCWATWHEFVVIALHQNIDVLYMLEVHGPLRTEKNLLRLGALHKKVKAHLERIIANPKPVIGADISFEMASLNRQQWEKQEVVYVALARILEWNLEHVNGLSPSVRRSLRPSGTKYLPFAISKTATKT